MLSELKGVSSTVESQRADAATMAVKLAALTQQVESLTADKAALVVQLVDTRTSVSQAQDAAAAAQRDADSKDELLVEGKRLLAEALALAEDRARLIGERENALSDASARMQELQVRGWVARLRWVSAVCVMWHPSISLLPWYTRRKLPRLPTASANWSRTQVRCRRW